MILGGLLGLVVGVALILAVGALLDHRMGLEEACRDRAKREREQAILRLEVELGFRDPEEVRWQPTAGSYGSPRLERRPRIETRPQARAYQLSDREVAQLLLRHKRGAA